jgi:hypothetical protein
LQVGGGPLGYVADSEVNPQTPPGTPREMVRLALGEVDRNGQRKFKGMIAGWLALGAALLSAAMFLFEFDFRNLMQVSLGLVVLTLGVRGWVDGPRASTYAAAAGLVVGIAVIPVVAVMHELHTLWGIGLGSGGVIAAGCALMGAQCLRCGWRALEPVERAREGEGSRGVVQWRYPAMSGSRVERPPASGRPRFGRRVALRARRGTGQRRGTG